MPWFPMFVDLTSRPCLIVGGGTVAARKAEKLLPYSPKLHIVAPEFVPGFDGCTLLRRPYRPGDEDGMALVIAATDDPALNRAVSAACHAKNIPVNVVDDKKLCSFLFPCLVQEGELSIGISTAGASPTAAIWMKDRIEDLVPAGFEEILAFLEGLRPRIKADIPSEAERAARFAALFHACMQVGRPLTVEEVEALL